MFDRLSQMITEKLITQKIIPDDQEELYSFGFNQGITMILNIITTLAIGFLLGEVLNSILFLAAYIPLRNYAGGYHAPTPLKCYLSSIGIMSAVLIMIKLIDGLDPNFKTSLLGLGRNSTFVVAFLLGAFVCALYAPQEDKNKPLDELEKKVYKRRTLIVLGAEAVLATLGYFWFRPAFEVICFACLTESVMIMAGYTKAEREAEMAAKMQAEGCEEE